MSLQYCKLRVLILNTVHIYVVIMRPNSQFFTGWVVSHAFNPFLRVFKCIYNLVQITSLVQVYLSDSYSSVVSSYSQMVLLFVISQCSRLLFRRFTTEGTCTSYVASCWLFSHLCFLQVNKTFLNTPPCLNIEHKDFVVIT